MPQFLEQILLPGLVFVCALILSLVMTRVVLRLALRFGWTTKANERSSHVGQLAFGGGAAVIGVSLVVWGVLAPPVSGVQGVVLGGAIVLAAVSWLDDLNNLPSGLRMLFHVGVVAISLMFLPGEANILPLGLPLFADRLLAGFFWIWFINLYNFMDGIDGLASVETIFVSLGIAGVAMLGSVVTGAGGALGGEWVLLALAIGGAALGFLPWNWHRASIMLGDLGAVPLGYLLGFLLIMLALEGYWVAALILPAYFIADATITIVGRLFRGEKFWRPHRTHFYQRASRPCEGHDTVVIAVGFANVVLVGGALLSVSQPLSGAILALIVVGILLSLLSKMAKGIARADQ
ncbi:MAG TPA: glycosyltransferase family 4 protein [Devosia sp.]|nr:glycosyltransferase family 4 protein [Devosia sp.]